MYLSLSIQPQKILDKLEDCETSDGKVIFIINLLIYYRCV